MSGNKILKIGFVNIFAIMQLTTIRTYFAIFLENDLLIDIIIISSLLTIQNLSQIFLRIPLANLSQIIGRKPLIMTGTISYTLALLFLGFADSWGFALVSVLLVAVGMSAYWPALFALIGDIADEGDKMGEMNGRIFQMGDIGSLIASGLASYLLSADTLVGTVSIASLYLTFCIIGAISNIFIYFVISETLRDDERLVVDNKFRDFFRSVTKVFSNFIETSKLPRMFPIYVMQFSIAFAEFGFGSYYPLILKYYGYLDSGVATLVLYSTFALILVKPKLGNVSDRFGYKIPISVSFIVIALSIIGILTFNNFISHMLLISVIVATFTVGYSAMNSYSVKTAPDNKRGIAMGTLGVYTSLGRGLSTLILGYLISTSDLIIAFYFFAGILFVLGISFLIYFKQENEIS